MEAFQAEVAWTALRAIGGQGFALAGAGALIAHGVVERLTQDLDLFSPLPGGPQHVLGALQGALEAAGYQVVVDVARTSAGGDFARLEVLRGEQRVQVDLGRDWREYPPVALAVGPVLHIDDAVGNKVVAMIGRSLPRDYLDVAASLRRYDRGQLLELGFRRDPGLRVLDVAIAMRRFDQLASSDFADYQLTPEQIAAVRATFADWPRDPAVDRRGEHAYAQVRRPLPPSTRPGTSSLTGGPAEPAPRPGKRPPTERPPTGHAPGPGW